MRIAAEMYKGDRGKITFFRVFCFLTDSFVLLIDIIDPVEVANENRDEDVAGISVRQQQYSRQQQRPGSR